ncbi:MAG: hypothetical protein N2Z20_02765 [Elusimicrobiales bacterium]|nr:hypothetical protein [Elusimicrobiales bacterium]
MKNDQFKIVLLLKTNSKNYIKLYKKRRFLSEFKLFKNFSNLNFYYYFSDI